MLASLVSRKRYANPAVHFSTVATLTLSRQTEIASRWLGHGTMDATLNFTQPSSYWLQAPFIRRRFCFAPVIQRGRMAWRIVPIRWAET